MSTLIMVVDDEDLTRALYKHVLVRAGYSVLEASNGHEALEKLASTQPDLIIMDVLMPGMDGFTTIKQIRENLLLTDLPIIFLSSRADVAAEYQGLSSGAQRYLIKPISMLDLEREVRDLLTSKV
jgi:CheY-like chemotaxis protein